MCRNDEVTALLDVKESYFWHAGIDKPRNDRTRTVNLGPVIVSSEEVGKSPHAAWTCLAWNRTMAGVVPISLEATIPSVSAPHTNERCNAVPDLSPRIIASIFFAAELYPQLG